MLTAKCLAWKDRKFYTVRFDYACKDVYLIVEESDGLELTYGDIYEYTVALHVFSNSDTAYEKYDATGN